MQASRSDDLGKALSAKVQDLRGKQRPGTGLSALWTGEDHMGGRTYSSFTAVLKTKGCSWAKEAGCTMCGYYIDSNPRIGEKGIKGQIENLAEQYQGQEVVKLYTSGSFLDENELAPELRKEIFSVFQDAKYLVIESRPEFIKTSTIKTLNKLPNKVQVALGLESYDQRVLDHCINKGTKIKDYERAWAMLEKHEIGIRNYVLLKPIFLTEKEALLDSIRTIIAASQHSDVVSVNPMNVQRGTLVEHLWKRNGYRPPWLWTLVEALRRARVNMSIDCTLVSIPSGAGSRRGVHNCGECDKDVMKAIEKFNRDQSFPELRGCSCQELWAEIMEDEAFFLNSLSVEKFI